MIGKEEWQLSHKKDSAYRRKALLHVVQTTRSVGCVIQPDHSSTRPVAQKNGLRREAKPDVRISAERGGGSGENTALQHEE